MDIQAEIVGGRGGGWRGGGKSVVKEEIFNKSVLVVLEGEVGGLN